MFGNFVRKLPALLLLFCLVSISIFVFHTFPLYGAEASPSENSVLLGLEVLEQNLLQEADGSPGQRSGLPFLP